MTGIRAGLCAAMVISIAGAALQAQAPAGPNGPGAEVQRSYNGLKANILKAANTMPADNYTYKPTPDVRTFARVVEHVIEAQQHSCGAVNGTAMGSMSKVPDESSDKATIVQALQASFAACDQAMASVTEANALEMLSAGPAKRSRLGLLWGTVSHDNEQYATLALYMRLKGLEPPSSER